MSQFQGQWNAVYCDKFNTLWYPNEDVVRFCARLLQKRLTYDTYDVRKRIERVLDLGCGNGRHVTFFARQGLVVSGIDISKQAIEWAQDWCRREQLVADLLVGDITSLPYPDQTFDVTVSHGVLDHVFFEQARRAAEEVHRVLKPGGLFYCDLRSSDDFESGVGERVAPNTFVLDHGYEAGLIQHFFTIQETQEMLAGLFRIVYTETNDRRIGPDFSRKYSRWVVTSERL